RKGDAVNITVKSVLGGINNPEYAFYLMLDGKKREVRWYNESSSASFQLPRNVSYSTLGLHFFVRDETSPKNNVSTIRTFSKCDVLNISEGEGVPVYFYSKVPNFGDLLGVEIIKKLGFSNV